MQALAQWQRPLASSEALVVLHWAMRPALHRRIRMVVEIVVNLPISLLAINTFAKDHVMINIKLIRVTNMFISML